MDALTQYIVIPDLIPMYIMITSTVPQIELLCDEDDVADILANLDTGKATGIDGISARMLKAVSFTIAPSLTKLFNLSLSNGTIPSEWKTSRIVPLPKGSNKSIDIVLLDIDQSLYYQ